MRKLEDCKQKKVQDIVSVVKLFSLVFAGTILFRYFVLRNTYSYSNANDLCAMAAIVSAIFLVVLIYAVWTFSIVRKIRTRYIELILHLENGIFMIIFSSIACISGAQNSEYRYIFLFIIIASTIQNGLKSGMLIAFLSVSIILGIDMTLLPNAIINQNFESDLSLSAVFILITWPLGYYVKVGEEHIAMLEGLANQDGLTGVYNHRYFYDKLREKMKSSEADNKHVSMIFIDIDYFKHYNDLYGHQQGDEVLRGIGQILKDKAREEDVVARYGGEEFAIILPDTKEEQAIEIAEDIRKSVESAYFKGEENQPNGRITISVGVSTFPEKAKNDVELIKSADDALYKAKFFSKNRVVTYSSILDELKKDIEEKHIDLVTSIKTLISVINAKDKYTYGHVERVVMYCRLLGKKLSLNEEDQKTLIYGAYMHDIGKINIGKEILNKKMPLTSEEWEILKQHSASGVDIIKPVESLKDVAPLILYHHERYDGTGYPQNLKGNEIPMLARILSVADSFDAMTSNRPYNKRKTYEEGIEELKVWSGTQFDPYIASKFIEVILENKLKFDNLVSASEESI